MKEMKTEAEKPPRKHVLTAVRTEAQRRAGGLVPASEKPAPGRSPKTGHLSIDAICDAICETKSMRQIAEELNVSLPRLLDWIEADAERLARAREARRRTALLWEERAEAVLAQAGDTFELQKARELAHHYRWRAKAIAPREYGEKVMQEHTVKDGAPIAVSTMNLKSLSDAELESMQRMLSKAATPAEVIDVEAQERG